MDEFPLLGDPVFAELSRTSKARFEKFARGIFEIGVSEPEEVTIVTPRMAILAMEWACFYLNRSETEAFYLAVRILEWNINRLR